MGLFFSAVTILAWLFAGLAVAGSAYQLAAAYAVFRHFRPHQPAPAARPAATLLKPLHGDEAGLYENLSSFCRLDYPVFQIVCGVRRPDDPAIAVVNRLKADFPGADIALVSDPRLHGTNHKVSNLINMMAAAKHGLLVLSDSDMRVRADYLNVVAEALERPGTGIATFLYVGRPRQGCWSALGAAGINFGFLPSAAMSKLLGGQVGCYGATIALTRQTLDWTGGFAALKDQLADDYVLGASVRALGLEIAVAPQTVDTVVDEPSFRALFRHELRWARTIRNNAPAGYAASAVTHPVPLALAALGLGLTQGLAWPILAAILALAGFSRFALSRSVMRFLGAPGLAWWLLLPRDVLSLAVLILAYCGRSVSWRDSDFRLDAKGSLIAERD